MNLIELRKSFLITVDLTEIQCADGTISMNIEEASEFEDALHKTIIKARNLRDGIQPALTPKEQLEHRLL